MEIQSILIKSYQVVRAPNSSKQYVQYNIEVGTKLKVYQVKKRYSDFERLLSSLKGELGSEASRKWLPALPPKSSTILGFVTGSNGILNQPDKILERQSELQRLLKTILVHKELKAQTTRSPALSEFLEFDSNQSPNTVDNKSVESNDVNKFTSQTWLAEHNEIRTSVREVYDLAARRDEVINEHLKNPSPSNLAEVNRVNVNIKRLLAGINARLGTLAESLEQFLKPAGNQKSPPLTAGEVARRAKLIASLQDDCERLGKMAVLARTEIGAGMRQAHRALSPDSNSRDRAELLGTSHHVRPTTRVLGRPERPAEETSETKQRDNKQLMKHQLHQTIEKDQEAKIRSLAQILLRQKQIGLMINQELVEQNEILDDLSNAVDSTSRKLKDAKKKIDVLS